jgi:predicted alpha/beta hydrolase
MKIISADSSRFGQFNGTVFRLETDNEGKIAVTHIPANGTFNERAAIVMMPGMFSNRRFYLSDKGIGLAAYLSELGFSCWIVERRGLGKAGTDNSATNTLFNTYQHDLPAVQALLEQQRVGKAFYMGHSFGGVLNGMSVAHGYLKPEGVAGLVNLSSQLTVGKRLLNKPYSVLIYALTALLGYFPAKTLGMGPENESKQVMRDCCRFVDWAKGKQQKAYWQGFAQVSCPILGIGSVGDTVDPMSGCEEFVSNMGSAEKTFIKLGKHFGHTRDYDHVGMLVSKDAQKEVWPLLSNWLIDKST